MDGLDLALVRFEHDGKWSFHVLGTGTTPFSAELLQTIEKAFSGNAFDLAFAHKTIGKAFGKMALDLLSVSSEKADLISSHGHTIFHQPELSMTFQAGSGAEIAAITGIDTVCDLRTTDISLGGQGAPLVPVGEKALFPDHNLFLNLGGIANISIHGEKTRAFDICHCNMILNTLAVEVNKPFDENGDLARSGNIDQHLHDRLSQSMTVHEKGPHSIGREHFEGSLASLLEDIHLSTEDKLRTSVEVIATCIAEALNGQKGSTVMVTGGGAYNAFLIERIREISKATLFIPESTIVEFKEAIIFAFLGLLRSLNKPNCFKDVTGAKADNIGGAIYSGNSNKAS